MKTFHEFITEDFNSNGATQFELKSSGLGESSKMIIFFEKIPVRPFSLGRYMKSFGTTAKEIMRNNSQFGWRGIVFHKAGSLLIFVWSANYLHHDICKALDNQSGVYPKHKYLRSYNDMYLLGYKEPIGDEWCFPFTYNTSVDSNLNVPAINELIAQKGIGQLFGL